MNNEDALKSGIRQLGYEVQALQEEANRLTLPDDIPALLQEWLLQAEELSNELPQKPLIKKQLNVALNDYRLNDIQQVRLGILRAMKNFENAGHDKWVMGVQKQYGHNKKALLKRNEEVVKPKHDEWQRLADKFRSECSRKMSKTELAEKIKKELDKSNPGKSGAVNYIRKNIDKK